MHSRLGILVVLAMATSLGLTACKRGSEADEHSTSSARAPKGTTGKSASDTATMGGPAAVPDGSTNRTPKGSVGNR